MNHWPRHQGESSNSDQIESSVTHAIEYTRTAALLRRRALQVHRTEEERTELLRRADWYERRAAVKREGRIMPRELRTPLESLVLVDEFRQRLVGVLDLERHLASDELEAFSRSMMADKSPPWSECADEFRLTGVDQWRDFALELLAYLGGCWCTGSEAFVLSPFAIPTAVRP